MNHTEFSKKVRITGTLFFETAFHIGSGKEGGLATDMGVLKDEEEMPVLPGSTLKGNFRATAERLAGWLGLSACMLDRSLSGVDCVGDQGYFREVNEAFKKRTRENEKLAWLSEHTCQVCRLFGSPLQAARIFFSDGRLMHWPGGYQIRDGVAIDRDSGTARDGLKYDFEVTAKDTTFEILIDLENPEADEMALVAAVLAEWRTGFRLGGFTSRGLGRVVLTRTRVEQVDYRDPTHLKAYLLHRALQPAETLLDDALNTLLDNKEAAHA